MTDPRGCQEKKSSTIAQAPSPSLALEFANSTLRVWIAKIVARQHGRDGQQIANLATSVMSTNSFAIVTYASIQARWTFFAAAKTLACRPKPGRAFRRCWRAATPTRTNWWQGRVTKDILRTPRRLSRVGTQLARVPGFGVALHLLPDR